MRINLRDTKPMKRDLVYTTGELPTRPFDATRFLTPSPHQNRCRRPRVEKVGLAAASAWNRHTDLSRILSIESTCGSVCCVPATYREFQVCDQRGEQPQRQHDRDFASRKRQRYQGLAVGG